MSKNFYETVNEKIRQKVIASGLSEDEINEKIKQNTYEDGFKISWPGVISKLLKNVKNGEVVNVPTGTFKDLEAIEKLIGGSETTSDAEMRAKKMMVRTLSSFNGADSVIYVNGVCVGEIQDLKFNSTKKGQELIFGVAIFQDVYELTLDQLKDATVVQVFANEYGFNLVREFHGVSFVGEDYSIGVDTIVTNTNYIYSCVGYTRFKTVSQEEFSKICGTIGK